MGGTIFFDVEEYVPYYQKKIFDDTEKYIIYDVKPMHSGIAKRYSVSVILKEPFSFDEMAGISIEIVEKIEKVEVYSNANTENRWFRQDANIIWIYYGRDESDIINSNYICHTTWVDDTQDKQHWYSLSQNSFIKKDIHFNIHSDYEFLKTFNLKNIGNKNKLLPEATEIMKRLIALAEKVIALYNELKNQNITEEVMVQKMKKLVPQIRKAYFEETNSDIAPDELRDWKQGISNLAATIDDFTYFYDSEYMLQRNPENRLACMDMTISRYYNELERMKCLEN
jgi:soluble cytochrome b562